MGTAGQRSVLVVEDDELLLATYASCLGRKGHTPVMAADTAAKARLLLAATAPELAIIDLQLSDGNGLDLVRFARAKYPSIEIVLVTGYGSLEIGAEAIRAGANHVIAKPVGINEILQRVTGTTETTPPETPSADRAMWEHVKRVLRDCRGNQSEAARRLGIDRGTLARWLSRPAPR